MLRRVESELEVGERKLKDAEAASPTAMPNEEKLYMLFRDACIEQKIGTYKYKVLLLCARPAVAHRLPATLTPGAGEPAWVCCGGDAAPYGCCVCLCLWLDPTTPPVRVL